MVSSTLQLHPKGKFAILSKFSVLSYLVHSKLVRKNLVRKKRIIWKLVRKKLIL